MTEVCPVIVLCCQTAVVEWRDCPASEDGAGASYEVPPREGGTTASLPKKGGGVSIVEYG